MPKKPELSPEDQALRVRIGLSIRAVSAMHGKKPADLIAVSGISQAQQYRIEGGEAAPVRECGHRADCGAGTSVVECAVGGELLLHECLAAEHSPVGEMADTAAQERRQRKFAAGGDNLLERLG